MNDLVCIECYKRGILLCPHVDITNKREEEEEEPPPPPPTKEE